MIYGIIACTEDGEQMACWDKDKKTYNTYLAYMEGPDPRKNRMPIIPDGISIGESE